MKALALIACLCVSLSALAKDAPRMRTAKVISQDIGAYNGGAAVMPMGTGLIGVPITRHSNIVVIQTDKARITLSEMANKHFIILPVNGDITFYTDKNVVVIVDGDGKKHKFGIAHLETLATEKQP